MPVSSQATSSQSIMADCDRDALDRVAKGAKALRIVGAVLAVEGRVALLDVELHAPAVELDLVQPVRPGRRHLRQRRRHRLDEWDFTQHAGDVGW